MGRLLWVDSGVEQTINELQRQQQQVGLIIGQFSVTKDFALHFVRCPEPSEEGKEEVSSGPPKHSDDIDVRWVVEHARQVDRMLPGGLYVIGVYIFCDPKALVLHQPKLKQCLMSIHNKMKRNKFINDSFPHKERYFVHIDSQTNKITCRTFDSCDDAINFKPAEFKYQSFFNSWCALSTKININVHIPVPVNNHKTTTLENKVVFAFKREIDDIWNAYATTGIKLIDENQSVIDIKKVKKKNTKHSTVSIENIDVSLFKKSNFDHAAQELQNDKTEMMIKFIGSICSKAFIHSKGTYGEAVRYLKVDIIRSLLTRIELLCEEAQVNNLAQVDEWSLVCPVRVFVPFSSKNSIYFSDYVFKDESENDVIDRFSDVLNLNVNVDDLVYVEHSPNVAEVSTMLHLAGDKQSDINSDVASELSSSCQEESGNNKMYLTGGIMAGIAAISYSLVRLIYNE